MSCCLINNTYKLKYETDAPPTDYDLILPSIANFKINGFLNSTFFIDDMAAWCTNLLYLKQLRSKIRKSFQEEYHHINDTKSHIYLLNPQMKEQLMRNLSEDIEIETILKYLGVWLKLQDNYPGFTLSYHWKQIKQKCIGRILHFRYLHLHQLTSIELKINIFKSMILPKLSYAFAIWPTTTTT